VLLPVGFVLMTAFLILLTAMAATGSLVLMALLYIPVIVGSAFIVGPIQSFALSRLTPELNAHGVTIMSTGFQIAGCIGASFFSGTYETAIGFAEAAGALEGVAASEGFLATGVLLGILGVIGLILAFRAGTYKKLGEKVRVDAAPSVLSQILKSDVYTLSHDALVLDALRGFADKGVSGMPIVSEAGGVIGFVSDGDVMRYLADQHAAFRSPYSFIVESDNGKFNEKLAELVQMPVTEIATKHVISVDVDMGLGEICRILGEHRLKKAPVLADGKMIGIINRSNITQYSVSNYLENFEVATS
jgi:DHA2 family lincomycin resistance protein-like MFS transporter